MDYVQRIKSIIKFYLSASTAFNVHSPFAYDFIENVLLDKKMDTSFDEIENVRNKLLEDHSEIVRIDFGAGSSGKPQKTTIVSTLAKKSLSPPHTGRMFYRMVKHYNYKSILELGTSLGVSCLYLGNASPEVRVTSIEGDPAVYEIAVKNGNSIGSHNINYLNGEFDSFLDNMESLGAPYDMVLMDGNHSYEPTLKYFNLLWPHMNNSGAIIVDDIHWSEGMANAWNEIKENTRDAYFFETWRFGIAFRSVSAKSGSGIKWIPSYLKPWKAGFFK